MDAIRDDLKAAFAKEGYADVAVDLVLAPAWTTDWMTEAGKAKLRGVRHRPAHRPVDAAAACRAHPARRWP